MVTKEAAKDVKNEALMNVEELLLIREEEDSQVFRMLVV